MGLIIGVCILLSVAGATLALQSVSNPCQQTYNEATQSFATECTTRVRYEDILTAP